MGLVWFVLSVFIYRYIKCTSKVHCSVRLCLWVRVCMRVCMCACMCLAMASASLAAGISQSTDRTCCLSGRRVAIVTLSASLRCFWETIPHPNQPVWVPATGHSSFFLLSRLPVRFFSSTCLFFASSPLWTHSRGSGWDRWPHSALWGGKKKRIN